MIIFRSIPYRKRNRKAKSPGIPQSSWGHDSDSDLEQEGERLEDWNTRFQDSIGKMNDTSEDRTVQLEEQMEASLELLHLSQDFIYCAKTYGKIIISEVYVKSSKKTIKPISLGGQAGGDKYIANNILFKFAVDSHGLFHSSDYAAAKVRGDSFFSSFSSFVFFYFLSFYLPPPSPPFFLLFFFLLFLLFLLFFFFFFFFLLFFLFPNIN
jgi:hypothetical protein